MGAYEDLWREQDPLDPSRTRDIYEDLLAEISPRQEEFEEGVWDRFIKPTIHGVGGIAATPFRGILTTAGLAAGALQGDPLKYFGLPQEEVKPGFQAKDISSAFGLAETPSVSTPTPSELTLRNVPGYERFRKEMPYLARGTEFALDLGAQFIGDPILRGLGALAKTSRAGMEAATALAEAGAPATKVAEVLAQATRTKRMHDALAAGFVPGMAVGAVESFGAATERYGQEGFTPETFAAYLDSTANAIFAGFGAYHLVRSPKTATLKQGLTAKVKKGEMSLEQAQQILENYAREAAGRPQRATEEAQMAQEEQAQTEAEAPAQAQGSAAPPPPPPGTPPPGTPPVAPPGGAPPAAPAPVTPPVGTPPAAPSPTTVPVAPPVGAPLKRLYRGVPVDEDPSATGERFFTPDIEEARKYAGPGGTVVAVDIPVRDYHSYTQAGRLAGGRLPPGLAQASPISAVLPKEIVEQAVEVEQPRQGQPAQPPIFGSGNILVGRGFDPETVAQMSPEDVGMVLSLGVTPEMWAAELARRAREVPPTAPSPVPLGWKFHLATDNPESVSAVLTQLGLKHKVGRSDQVGKDITIYIGSRADADRIAPLLSQELSGLLREPYGETLRDDIEFAPGIMGRFDIARDDPRFHQYGAKGFPLLNEDLSQIALKNPDPYYSREAAEQRAQAALREKYGDFYEPSREPSAAPERPTVPPVVLPPEVLPEVSGKIPPVEPSGGREVPVEAPPSPGEIPRREAYPASEIPQERELWQRLQDIRSTLLDRGFDWAVIRWMSPEELMIVHEGNLTPQTWAAVLQGTSTLGPRVTRQPTVPAEPFPERVIEEAPPAREVPPPTPVEAPPVAPPSEAAPRPLIEQVADWVIANPTKSADQLAREHPELGGSIKSRAITIRGVRNRLEKEGKFTPGEVIYERKRPVEAAAETPPPPQVPPGAAPPAPPAAPPPGGERPKGDKIIETLQLKTTGAEPGPLSREDLDRLAIIARGAAGRVWPEGEIPDKEKAVEQLIPAVAGALRMASQRRGGPRLGARGNAERIARAALTELAVKEREEVTPQTFEEGLKAEVEQMERPTQVSYTGEEAGLEAQARAGVMAEPGRAAELREDRLREGSSAAINEFTKAEQRLNFLADKYIEKGELSPEEMTEFEKLSKMVAKRRTGRQAEQVREESVRSLMEEMESVRREIEDKGGTTLGSLGGVLQPGGKSAVRVLTETLSEPGNRKNFQHWAFSRIMTKGASYETWVKEVKATLRIRFELPVFREAFESAKTAVEALEQGTVVKEGGKLRVVYHGTADARFRAFDPAKDSGMNLYGPGFYFTEAKEIAETYKGKGAPYNAYREVTPGYVNRNKPETLEFLDVVREKLYRFYRAKGEKGTELTGRVEGDILILAEALDLGDLSIVKTVMRDLGIRGWEFFKDKPETAGVKEVFLDIKNPLDVDAPITIPTEMNLEKGSSLSPLLRELAGKRVQGQFLYDSVPEGPEGIKVLKALGFDGITYTGGRIIGGPAHKVWIAWEPSQIKEAGTGFEMSKVGEKARTWIDLVARARESIAARGKTREAYDLGGAAYEGSKAFLEHVIVGADYIRRGVKEFGTWSRRMLSEIGDWLRPYLKNLYSEATKIVKSISFGELPKEEEAKLQRGEPVSMFGAGVVQNLWQRLYGPAPGPGGTPLEQMPGPEELRPPLSEKSTQRKVPEDVQRIIDYAEQMPEPTPEEIAGGAKPQGKPDIAVNMGRIEGLDNETKAMLVKIAEGADENLSRHVTKAMDEMQIESLDELIKKSPDELQRAGISARNIGALRMLHLQKVEDLAAAKERLLDPSLSPAERDAAQLNLANAAARWWAAFSALANKQTEVARALAFQRHTQAPVGSVIDKMARMREALSKIHIPKPVQERIIESWQDGDLPRFEFLLRQAQKPGLLRMLSEGWKAGLIGPTSLIANQGGNWTFSKLSNFKDRVITPAVDVVVAKLTGTERERYYGEGGARAIGRRAAIAGPDGAYRVLLQDVLNAANLLNPKDISDPFLGRVLEELRIPAIPGRIGKLIRWALNILEAQDNASKKIVASEEAAAWSYNQLRKMGRSREEALEQVPRIMQRLIEVLKTGPDHPQWNIFKPALEHITKRTLEKVFQAPLEGLFQTLGSGIARHPSLSFLVPFYRTPVNIALETLKMSPAGFEIAYRRFRRGKLNRAEFAEELAKPVLGSMIATGVALAAAEGFITGGLSTDYRKRKAMEEQGILPYSIKIGDKYFSYQRIEPIAGLIGMVADMVEGQKSGEFRKGPEAVRRIIGSITENLTSKTFLSGLEAFFTMWSDPIRYAGRWARQMEGSVVPGVVAKVAQALDPVQRDAAANIFAPILARIPGASTTLPEKRAATGEPAQRSRTAIERFLSPIERSKARGKLAPVYEQFIEADYIPAPFKDYITLPSGKKHFLSKAEEEKLQNARLQASERLLRIVKDPTYLRLPPNEDDPRWRRGLKTRKRVLEDVYNSYVKRARNAIIAQVGAR